MKWKEIYAKCNHNKYSQITKVLNKCTISSNIKNLMKNYGIVILDITILIFAFLLWTFRSNLIIVLYCFILYFLMFLMLVFYSTYKISLKEDKIIARINLQDNEIPYDKLNSIYLSKEKIRIFFIPFYTYSLKVTYYIDEERINIFSFPIIMLNKQQVIKFFNSFEVETYKDQEEELKQEEKDRKNLYKAVGIVIGILFIILFIVSLVIYLMQ